MILNVRPMTPADALPVAGLAAEFAGYLRGLGDQGPHDLTADAIRRDGFGPGAAFSGLVAISDGDQTIGYLLYHLGYDADLAARNLHVIDLYVAAAARRRGAGRALMTEAAHLGRVAGARYLFWAVYRPNRLAADFYTALGARAVPDLDFMFINAESLE
jgi:ribosomal protein S18 acetylase RimI-like enzyme